jgi:predicted  nucleic acid-binding Zn-ribbon protein
MSKSTEKYRENITLHLVRISGDIEHIKEKVNSNNKHLEKINGRVRDTEKSVTAIKSIGSTLTFIVGAVLTWLGVQK